jgi:hypothetical protein
MSLRAADRTGLSFLKKASVGAAAWFDEASEDSGRAGYIGTVDRDLKRIPGRDAAFDYHSTPTAMALYGRFLVSKRVLDPRIGTAIPFLTMDPPKAEKTAVDFCYWHFASLAIFTLKGADSAE